jgi:hypothetical protein
MKKIIIFIIILTSFKSFSQIFPPAGSINYDSNLNKFEGTWKWNEGNGNEVTLKIKKIIYHYDMNGGFSEEKLVACHKYIKNGLTVEDNLSLYPILGQDEIGSVLLSLSKPDRLRGLFKDSLLNKPENFRLTYDGSTTIPTLKWQLYVVGRTYRGGVDPVPDNNTTLPKNLILVKQP